MITSEKQLFCWLCSQKIHHNEPLARTECKPYFLEPGSAHEECATAAALEAHAVKVLAG